MPGFLSKGDQQSPDKLDFAIVRSVVVLIGSWSVFVVICFGRFSQKVGIECRPNLRRFKVRVASFSMCKKSLSRFFCGVKVSCGVVSVGVLNKLVVWLDCSD